MGKRVSSASFITFSPAKIVFGYGSSGDVAEEVKLLRGSNCLVVTDPGVVAAGLLSAVEASLTTGGVSFVRYDKVEPEPRSHIIDEGAALYREKRCDVIIGIGGGSSLDVAKGISVLAANEGSILDYVGLNMVPHKGAPMILLPTTAGTGSEVTRGLVMTNEAQHVKCVVFTPYILPEVAVIDPELTVSMPPIVTADTGMDSLVHAIEAFVSTGATPMSDQWARKAIGLIGRYLPVACAKGSNREARYQLCMAALLSGLAFTNAGLGAVHALAYPLGTEYHMTHGRTNAIMLPHVMKFNLAGNPSKYRRIADLLGKDTDGLSDLSGARLSLDAVLDLLAAINVSCVIGDYRIPDSDLDLLVSGAMKQQRLFVPNPRDLSEDDVRSIYLHGFNPNW
ncbi:MAG: iron-containing alcohol dehydrogenase [Desulfofustis sp.]|nr:iron-containing alcohol dehydrogenase [Desulfofustis sp.]